MKKGKLIAAVLSLKLLSGCAEKSAAPSGNNARIVWNYGNADERGELYTDNIERLNFVDFGNMSSTLLCSKPNCTHSNAGVCSAFGMENHPILYGDKLYFFDVETDFDGDEVIDTTTVYKAEPDGTSRVKVCDIKGLELLRYTRMLIVGDKAYFSMDKTGWNEEQTATSGYNEVWFCCLDLSTGTFERIEKLHEGWCSSSWIFGLYDGKVIFSYSYSEEKVPYTANVNEIEKYFINVYKTCDIESGEISDLTLPNPLCIGGGYYVYEKDGGSVVLSENGKERFLPDFKGSTIENGMLFGGEKCADLSNGKIYKLNSSDDLVAYSGENYILKSYDFLTQTYEYIKISKEDYIGEAL